MSGPKRARAREVSGKVRQAFEKAFQRLEAGELQGVTELSDIVLEMLTANPREAFDVLAKYIPKEMLIDQEVTHRVISGEPLTPEEWDNTHDVATAVEVNTTTH